MHRECAHLKMPGLSRLNEISGGCEEIAPVSGSFCSFKVVKDDSFYWILQCCAELSKICLVVLLNSIRAKIQELNSTLFNHLQQIKTLKLEHLIGPKTISHATFDSQNTVVTIPENLPLTDSEKSLLSRGLNFAPIAKRTDEFSVKQDVEKFLRRIQLKAFFHDKEDSLSTELIM